MYNVNFIRNIIYNSVLIIHGGVLSKICNHNLKKILILINTYTLYRDMKPHYPNVDQNYLEFSVTIFPLVALATTSQQKNLKISPTLQLTA